ncbi:hypothetical protein CTEN210_04239 [Chaetoceros tenuissimus]|uniref:DUF1294 domain-containing protein n=1 Tax=Chaetoceros tenuissimus TaxID=426638 RepID=A0AAD3H2R7_9STRA|nr:hypothetical protein CTEN210_04239 [Chaetoceros tenuissimus]
MDYITLETIFPFGFSLKLQLFAFAIILYDKFISKTINRGSKRISRIPESGFYFLAFTGGIIGLYLGMQICRHKTSHQKRYFRRKLYVSAFLVPFLFKFCFNV